MYPNATGITLDAAILFVCITESAPSANSFLKPAVLSSSKRLEPAPQASTATIAPFAAPLAVFAAVCAANVAVFNVNVTTLSVLLTVSLLLKLARAKLGEPCAPATGALLRAFTLPNNASSTNDAN